jgi:hypothetical protein
MQLDLFVRKKSTSRTRYMNELSHEVHLYLNVFFAWMLNWIFGELNGTLIVALEGGQMLLLEFKL